ncbi:unnamed protein product [Candida verbasci]|uniref:Uncharacterized protein n=1 Tax=Candida verbasci TaxID=1227364 RepID=A0A9W4TW50_9ASCO|nr:unnamed protein product [Candida verbasci]
MDNLISKGQEFLKSGKVTSDDAKTAYNDLTAKDGGSFQDKAKKAYNDYTEAHKGDSSKSSSSDLKTDSHESKTSESK